MFGKQEYELVNGKEVMMSPAHYRHAVTQGNLLNIIGNYLRGKKCRVLSEFKVVFSDKYWLQPDILIICDKSKIKGTYIDGAPDFVAEILSATTYKRDIGIKKDIYEKYGVKEYWILDPRIETVTVYILREGKYILDNVYHNYHSDEWKQLDEEEKKEQSLTLKISLYDDLEINVKEIFEDANTLDI